MRVNFPQTNALPGCATPRLRGDIEKLGFSGNPKNWPVENKRRNNGSRGTVADRKSREKSRRCSANVLGALVQMTDLEKSCLLYFITTDRQAFPIKIGKTTPKNISSRFTGLQVASPWPLRVLLVVECEPAFERHVHRKSKGEHIRGEWYVPTIDLVRMVQEVADEFPDWVEHVPAWFRKNIGPAVQ